MRTLASIQKIIDLKPIEGADKIEVATVLGWHVVVKKGEFQVGDLCVYIEIDSLLPVDQRWAFLQSGGVKNMMLDGKVYTGYRLKTVKLRGQISQGICFQVPILGTDFPYANIEEGQDVTDILGIVKYEPPVPAQLAGKMRGNFPGFLPKTDETRIQAYPRILERYQDRPFYVTEKLDGSSATYTIKNGEFHVCSRNLDLLDDGANTFWRVAKELNIESMLRDHIEKHGEGIAIQGEIVGEGIQKNPLNIKGQQFYAFNIYDFIQGRYWNYSEFKGWVEGYGLPLLPIVHTNYFLPRSVDEIVAFATRKSEINKDGWAEGYVFRPIVEAQDEDLGRLSFKVINPEYLLKHE